MKIKIGYKIKCLNNLKNNCIINEIYEIEDIIYYNGYTFFDIVSDNRDRDLIVAHELKDFEVI